MNLGINDGIFLGKLGVSISSASPAGDPIGDALRADAVAYYKLDSDYLDSTANNNDLVAEHWDWNTEEYAADATGLSHVAGKIGNGVQLIGGSTGGGSNGTGVLQSASLDFNITGQFAWAFWLKSSLIPDNTITDFIGRSDPDEVANFQYFILQQATTHPSEASKITATSGASAITSYGQVLLDTDWYFVVLEFDGTSTLRLYVNNNAPTVQTDVVFPDTVALTRLCFGGDLAGNYAGNKIIDEAGYWARVLTSDERDYLYNSGDGRTLYP